MAMQQSDYVMLAANILLQMAGRRQRLASFTKGLESGFQYRSARRKTIVVPINFRNGAFIVIKSILQRVDEWKGCNWLINGQAGTNTQELCLFTGQAAYIEFSREDLRRFRIDSLTGLGHSPDEAERLADAPNNALDQCFPGREFPETTTLVFYDEHDHPHRICLEQAAMQSKLCA